MIDTDSNKTRRIPLLGILLYVALLFALFGFWTVVAYDYGGATYESSDRGFADAENLFKKRTLDVIEAQFETYKEWKRDPSLRLYRTSKRSWSSPNLWLDNFTNRRWSIPYMEPSPHPEDRWFVDYVDDQLGEVEAE